MTIVHTSALESGQIQLPSVNWAIVLRGRKPSCTACLVSEYVPVMTACEAMTAAAVARITIG